MFGADENCAPCWREGLGDNALIRPFQAKCSASWVMRLERE
ncbi:hypothetical protein SCH4B_4125 [Ruegeria sp. TrichCH4B]|nr:hypothetical protein SCH4B_4125 [Ruegeria sp. TrichCH4B]